MKYLVIFLVLVGVSGFAYALDEKSSNTSPKSLEEYKIEIGGLNDKYVVGENYYFYFIISGYGYSCASYEVSYPDNNGEIIHMNADPLCNPNQSKQKFEINSLHHPIDLANVGITKPGNYTVTVTFDKPSKDFPTTASKEFQVVKTLNGNFPKLAPLKQFKSGISIDEIQCKENLVLIQKYDDSPACVKPESVPKLVQREWGISENWIKISNANKAIHYELGEGQLEYVFAFSEYNAPLLPEENQQTWLQIRVEPSQEDNLKIILPRNLIDSKINNVDGDFFVLLDGVETEYQETKTDSERILRFDITPKVDIVEIVGHGYYNSELRPSKQDSKSEGVISDCPELIDLGYDTRRRIVSCGANPPQAQHSILEMEEIKTCFMDPDQYYYLKAGEEGSITYQYEITENRKDPSKVFDLDQEPHFMCKQGGFVTCHPSGINVNYEFDDQYIPVGKPAIITANIKVEKDTPSQSFVLHLSPNICANPEILFGVLGDD